nr:MAG TPA: hypothetical protein [Caudoviricetes sp.]
MVLLLLFRNGNKYCIFDIFLIQKYQIIIQVYRYVYIYLLGNDMLHLKLNHDL